MPKLSTKQEIIDYIGLDWRTILAEGFPVTKIGNRIFSHTDSIDDFIKQKVKVNPLKKLCQEI
jgi:hypothetical protein